MKTVGRTFLVTGGISGLGAATAKRLVEDGANVVVASRRGEDSQSNPRFVKTDIADEESVRGAMDIAREISELRGVVNCAGIAMPGLVVGKNEPHSLESFAKVVEVNLIGTFNVIRLAAEAMRENEPDDGGERGVIVNTASVAAFEGQVGQAAYAASKGGIVSMTLPIARELARFGIRVVTIAPGIFDTPMIAKLPEKVRESLDKQVSFPPRLGRPEEYATFVRQIFENPMLNGAVIRLDGAIRMAFS